MVVRRLRLTYWSGDEESGEEVEESIECCSKNGCNLVVWCDGDSHHSIICEVEEGEEGDKEEPEELCCCPFEAYHGVNDECVVCSLDKYVWYFTDDLRMKQT